MPWHRNERIDVLSRWTGDEANLGGKARGRRDLGKAGNADQEDEYYGHFGELLELTDKFLLDEIAALLKRFAPERLAVLSHRELALLPMWHLVDQCSSIEALTIAPSMELLNICVNRIRVLQGRTCVVPDATGTLRYAGSGLQLLQAVRRAPVEVIGSVENLVRAAPECNVLHVAGHGVYNPENPYYSGCVVGPAGSTAGLYAQFIEISESDGVYTFSFSDQGKPGQFELVTVGECLAGLSLNACGLAVLSACECGLANPHGGGELIGLPNTQSRSLKRIHKFSWGRPTASTG